MSDALRGVEGEHAGGLAVSGVRVAFGDRRVLDGVEARVPKACSVALVGPSGSGKTTLLAVIGGLLVASAGVVRYANSRVDSRDTAWVMQTSALLGARSARSNVALGPLHKGLTRARSCAIADAVLADLGMEEWARTPVRRLSGGERQRVAVARALAQSAPIVIADEPTASLDAHSRDRVIDALLAVEDAGRLVVIATHDYRVAKRCSTVLELVDGRVR